MNWTCPTHGLPAKWVPAGVSKKTGKAYTGFFTCPERGCQERPPEAAPQSPKPDPQPAPQKPQAGNPGGVAPSQRGTSEQVLLIIAALDFASRVHQGGSDGLAAMVTAREAYRAARAGLPMPAAMQDSWVPADDVPNFD